LPSFSLKSCGAQKRVFSDAVSDPGGPRTLPIVHTLLKILGLYEVPESKISSADSTWHGQESFYPLRNALVL